MNYIETPCLREIDQKRTTDHIRVLREQRNLTRAAVAAYLGVSESAVRNYELSLRTPTTETYGRLCDLFALPALDDLIIWKE